MADEKKWWQDGLTVGVLGIVAAAVTALHDGYTKARDLQVQQAQEVEHLRTTYAGVLAEGGVQQVALLADFIASTESDPVIKAWAERQKVVAQQQVDDTKKQLDAAQTAAASSEAARLKAETEAALAFDAVRQAHSETDAAQKAQANLRDAQAKLADATVKASTARQAVDTSSTRLLGQRAIAPQAQQPPSALNAALMGAANPTFQSAR